MFMKLHKYKCRKCGQGFENTFAGGVYWIYGADVEVPILCKKCMEKWGKEIGFMTASFLKKP